MKVNHKDVRILREALSHIAKFGPPMMRERSFKALIAYALGVREYCIHPDESKVGDEYACIDCGHRRPVK